MVKHRAVRRLHGCPGPPRGALLLGPAFVVAILLFASLNSRSTPIPNPDPGSSSNRSDSNGRRRTTDPERTDPVFPLVREFRLDPGTKPFDNEQSRRVGFPVANRGKASSAAAELGGRERVIFLATPYFGEWNPRHFYFLHLGNATFHRYACPIADCRATRDPSRAADADAVLFHVRDTEAFSFPPRRTARQVWILYSMEPPWLELRDLRRFGGIFNWTMSYRRNSDLTLRYGFVGRTEKRTVRSKEEEEEDSKKSDRAVWLVSNCNTDSNREGYVRRLRRVYPVDVVGGCGREGCRPAETRRCYLDLARRYKFYLAFENALCRDYVTEKLFNVLEYRLVPVVLGGADYASIAPPGAVIDASDFPSPEALGRHLWLVSRNDSLYRSYFQWKRGHGSFLQPWMCDLCETLHRRTPPAAAPAWSALELEAWWRGRCRRWTDDGFREIEQHDSFPKYRAVLFPDGDNSTSR